jgi:acyl-ACP thioesterase
MSENLLSTENAVTTPRHEPLVERPADGRIYESRRRVRLGDCSPGGRMRLDACARFLQDIANDDSRDAGTPNPTAWVARRTVIRVDRFPSYLDMVTLSTWCSGLGPRWAERRYEVFADENGGRIEAATLWVHIDMATMKPVPVPDGFAEQFGAAAGGRTVKARLHLPLRPPESSPPESSQPESSRSDPAERTRIVTSTWPLRFVDFDVLGHVNNSVYWAIVEEQLAARRELRAPLTITLEHHAGIDPGDAVSITTSSHATGFDVWVTTGDGRVTAVVSATG